MFLQNKALKKLMSRKTNPLVIRPILNPKQIGEISIDLRLGTDFLVSINNRYSSLSATKPDKGNDTIQSFFQESRRRPGDSFLLHPHQIILATSLEYTCLASE